MEQSVRYTVTEDDCVQALRLHWRPTRGVLSIQIFLGTFVIIMAIFGPTQTIQLLAVACILVFFLTRRVIGPWIQRNTFRKSKILQEPLILTYDDEGVHLKGESGESRMTWDRLMKWKDSETYLLMYISPRQYYIIPKRLRDQDFDVDGLCERLAANVST